MIYLVCLLGFVTWVVVKAVAIEMFEKWDERNAEKEFVGLLIEELGEFDCDE